MIRAIDLSEPLTAARVLAIQQAAYRVEADLIGFDGIPPLHDTLERLSTHRLTWLGAFEDEVLVGVLGWCDADDRGGPAVDIDRLAVDPAFARRGHGRRLVEALLHHGRVVVSTGTANAPARALYESFGFRRTGQTEIAPGVTTTQYERRTGPGPA